ncbi:MAG: proline racemase family protein, partial [Mycobacteriales bacterium]
VLFWHSDGFSTACGHGTIALGAWAVESGQVPSTPDSETEVVLDVPSGRVVARVRRDGGAVADVTFRNVPATVLARDVPAAGVRVDLADGGARYASVPAAAFGLTVSPDHLPDLIRAGRAVKHDLGGDLYGVILYEEVGPDHQRNVTVFADGQVDRSPCGSGTSARLALLAGELGDRPFTHESILGTRFTARIVGEAGGGVVTEVTGAAYRTGEHTFVLDPRDELGTGFVLR